MFRKIIRGSVKSQSETMAPRAPISPVAFAAPVPYMLVPAGQTNALDTKPQATVPAASFLAAAEVTGLGTVGTTAALNTAILAADNQTTAGTYEIDLSSNITLSAALEGINLHSGVSLVINGQGNTLDGGGTQRGLFVYSGNVTVEDLTIASAKALGGAGGNSGTGNSGGGGGAGLGGGLFVAAAGTVTVQNVSFSADSAQGGQGGQSLHITGGAGGGGGLGGNGGSANLGSTYGDGGGGGIGVGAAGGNIAGGNGSAGIIPGAAAGGSGLSTGAGGASGGGGGGGIFEGGAGGGIGGGANAGFEGGVGGFGGGGGGAYYNQPGAAGGFGGGGGGNYHTGGAGGFGGGGGGNYGGTVHVSNAPGGFGAGNGNSNGGGGGLGAGGDIFVQQGGTLLIEGGTLGAGAVTGGTGPSSNSGSAYGSSIFLQGDESLTLASAAGTTTTISGAIADQAGSGGTGAGTLLIGGSTATGTVVLAAANNFTGGLILGGGTLELAHTGAAGSGTIGFANGQSAALKLDLGDVPANILAGFSVRDAIDFAGIGTATAATLDSGDTLTISGGSSTATLHLTGNYTGDHFGVFSDGAGGTVLGLSVPSPTSLALALASISGTVGTATDIATPSITGNGSSGDTISLYDGTLVVGSTVETSTTWSVQTSSLAVGTHTLTATQTDLNGNISPASAAFGLTIVAPPATPANLSLDQASRTSTLATTTDITAPSIDGTGTVGDTIKLYDGTLLVGSTVATSTAWSVQTSSLAVGTHTLTATQTDPYGDVSAASAALSLTIVSPPAAATNLSLDRTSQSGTMATATDITTPSIDGTGTVGDTIKLYDGTLLVGSTVATSTAWSVQTSSLAAGTHTLTATQTDSYGDVSAASTALSLTIVSPPAAPTNLSLDQASQSGTLATATDITTPSIDGIGTVGDTIKLYDGTLLVGSTVATSTAWSVQTSSLAVGTHTLTATQTDSYGDVSAASAALGLTIVAVPDAPTTPTLDPGSISGTLADTTDITTPSIDGTGTIGDTISLFDGTLLVGSTVATSTAWSVQTSSLSVGTHMLTATETDPYGNVSVASAALALTIVAPPNSPTDLLLAPASDSGVLGDDITNVTSPSIQGRGTAGDTIWLYDGSSLVGTTAVAQDGAWSVTAGPLADGVHSLTAKESSPSGDVSAASAPLVVTIDSVLPQAPTLAETVRTTNPAEPILDGAATSGDVVTIFQDGTAIGTTTAASGTWQFAYTGVLDTGAYALSATATDVAGNVSAQSAPLKIVVAADMSYSVVAPIAGTDTNQVNIYNSAGTLSTVQVQTPQGRVLTSVTEGQALLNIYDIAGTLVGTITQPTTAAFATPVYTTTPLTEGASTDGGTLDSMVDLLSEQNRFVSHGNADITAHAGSATIFGLGASTIVNDIDANVTFYGGTGQASVYGGSGQLVAIGGSGGGTLVGGTGGDNVLVAGGGTTTLVGVADGDTLFGSAQGTDTEFAGAGHEILVGGGGTDTMVAGDGTDAFGAAGTTTMFAGNNGGSTLVGGSGATVMVAGGGTANMWAGSGITTMWAGLGTDVMGGNAAITSDTIMVGGTGNDIFVGGNGTITAYSGTGHDTFFTAAGTMTIFGGTGPDTIAFGSGSAVVHGGTGADTYVLTAGYGGGTEMIYDFKVGVDQLDMFGYAPNDMQESLGASGLTMSFSDGTNILLVGVTQLAVNSLK